MCKWAYASIRRITLLHCIFIMGLSSSLKGLSEIDEDRPLNLNTAKLIENIEKTYSFDDHSSQSNGSVKIYLDYNKCDYALSSISHIAIASDTSLCQPVEWNLIKNGVKDLCIGTYLPEHSTERFFLGFQVVSTFRKSPVWQDPIYWPIPVAASNPAGKPLTTIKITLSSDLQYGQLSFAYAQ